MVGDEHIKAVEAIGIIVACTDGDAFLNRILVPAGRTAIYLIGILHKVVETIDAVGLEHVVGFREDSIADLALRRTVKLVTISICAVTRFGESLIFFDFITESAKPVRCGASLKILYSGNRCRVAPSRREVRGTTWSIMCTKPLVTSLSSLIIVDTSLRTVLPSELTFEEMGRPSIVLMVAPEPPIEIML